MGPQVYLKILKFIPEILRMQQRFRISDELKEDILRKADGVLCISGLIMGAAAMLGSFLNQQDNM